MAWNGLKTWTPGDPLLAQQLIDYINANLDYLLKPNAFRVIDTASSFPTASASYVNIDATLAVNLTTFGGHVLVGYAGEITVSAPGTTIAEISVAIDGGSDVLICKTTTLQELHGSLLIPLVAAGAHTLSLRFRATSGTITFNGNSVTPILFWGAEL